MTDVDSMIRACLEDGDLKVDIHNGRVYSTRGKSLREMPVEITRKGYMRFRFMKDGVQCHFRVHRVVYIAAYGSIPKGLTIDHINNDKSDNRVCNLQVLTNRENIQKAWKERRARRGMLLLDDKETGNVRINSL